MKISMIVAHDLNLAIGKDNELLWPHMTQKADMRRFRTLTKGKPVIMGRKTWDSIPESFRPLKGRQNIILTRNPKSVVIKGDMTIASKSLAHSLGMCKVHKDEEIFIIGGEAIYAEAAPFVDNLYVTIIHKEYEGADAFIQGYKNEFNLQSEESFPVDDGNYNAYSFQHWTRDR